MSLSPQVCKKSYKVKIPTLGENCEFWLITVTDESGITNPNKDHAYLTDSGKLYIYNGKTLIQVNCDICFTQEERDKLEGIEEGANKYVLPVATDNALGGIKTGFTQTEKQYAVEVTEEGQAYVTVPWNDTVYTLPVADTDTLGGVKLGYSQNGKNYPVVKDSEGNIYVAVPWEEYSLPQAETNTLGGIKTGYEKQGQNYPVLVDVDGNAYVTVPWTNTDTKYNVVSTTENGLAPMLPTENADKKFLNGDGEWVEVNDSINGNTVTGSTFSGETSDCGVQILEVQGKTVQNGTPSPDSPVEIENVEISEIVSYGKNIFSNVPSNIEYTRCTYEFNDVTKELTLKATGNDAYIGEVSYKGNNYKSTNGTLYLVPKNATKVYVRSEKGVFNSINITFYDKDQKSLGFTGGNYTIPENAKYISLRIGVYPSTSETSYTDKLYFSFEEISGEYIDGHYDTIESSLTLAEGDTYENGQITRVRKQITFDGSSDESWGNIDSQNGYGKFYINLPNAPILNAENIENILSNIFEIKNNISYWNNPSENCISWLESSEKGRIGVVFDGATDLTSFKSWLSTHNLVVEYELETPTTEQFKLPTIPSYYPYTDVSTDSEVDPEITFRPLPFTTCLVGEATEEESGYMPPLSGNSNEFLNGNGEWSVPSGYTLPQASTTTLGGVKIGSNITVSSGTISLTKANVVSALGYTPPTTNTTYSLATTSSSGLLRQLSGNTSQFLNGNGQWATPPNTTYGVATTSKNGLMSATDKSRLDQLWAKFDSMVFFTED